MEIPAKDRFLDCVLHRAWKDLSVNPLILLLIVPGSLAFTIYFLCLIYMEWGIWLKLSDGGEYLLSLFLSMDISFIAYVVMTSLTLHTERMIEWTGSLADYAEGDGRDASELRGLAEEMESQRIGRGRLLAFSIFMGMIAMMVLSFLIFDFGSHYEDNPFAIPERIILALAVADLIAVSLFGLFNIYRIDSLQCRFTDAFVGAMGDDRLSDPMVSNIGKRKLVTHIALAAAAAIAFVAVNMVLDCLEGQGIEVPRIQYTTMILGLYFTFLFFYVIFLLNKHIRTVWGYENHLVLWMAEREGAKRIVPVPLEGQGAVDHWGRSLGKVSMLYKVAKWLKKLYYLTEF